MKKLSFIILIILSSFGIFIGANSAKASPENTNKKKAVYFYQEACSHCQAVDKFFKENGVYDKYDIEKIEISGVYNLNYFNEFFDAFGISSQKRGWPAIFFGQKFLVGDKPIQENFVDEIEKTEASDFPSPEKIRKYKEEINNLALEKESQMPLLILLGAALADSVSPCILAIFIILSSLIIFGNPKDKKEVFIFGAFFLLAIFLTYFALGVNMFGFNKTFKLPEIFSRIIGLAIIFAGLFLLGKYWKNLKLIKENEVILKKFIQKKSNGISESIWNFIKRNIQKMNLTIAALLIGFISSGFLLPCANRPYGIFISLFHGEKDIFSSILMILFYNFIFILPVTFLLGIIYYFFHTKKLEIFRNRHEKLIRIIVSVSLIFIGSYFICINCF